MLKFSPVYIKADKNNISPEISDRIKFFTDSLKKSDGEKSETIIYYICYVDCILLFKTRDGSEITGMLFEGQMMRNSWFFAAELAEFIQSASYDDISSGWIDTDMLESIQDGRLYNLITEKYRKRYTAKSFITGSHGSEFYGIEAGTADFLTADPNEKIVKAPPLQKQCIAFNDDIAEEEEQGYIEYTEPEPVKKSIFSIFTSKKESHQDFLNNTWLVNGDLKLKLKENFEIYHIHDEVDSCLIKLSDISANTGGDI